MSNVDIFSKMVSVEAKAETTQFIHELNQKYAVRLSTDFINQHGTFSSMFEKDTYFANGDVIQELKETMSEALVIENFIRRRTCKEEIQNATPYEQRWLCAEPTLQTMMRLDAVDAYGIADTLTQPDTRGEDRRDYKIATSGVCGLSMDDDSIGIFEDSAMNSSDKLSSREKVNLTVFSWQTMRSLLNRNIDPTSEFEEDELL